MRQGLRAAVFLRVVERVLLLGLLLALVLVLMLVWRLASLLGQGRERSREPTAHGLAAQLLPRLAMWQFPRGTILPRRIPRSHFRSLTWPEQPPLPAVVRPQTQVGCPLATGTRLSVCCRVALWVTVGVAQVASATMAPCGPWTDCWAPWGWQDRSQNGGCQMLVPVQAQQQGQAPVGPTGRQRPCRQVR